MATHLIAAKLEHIPLVAIRVRPRDVEELRQGYNQTPTEIMSHALGQSSRAFTLLHGTVPFCMAGVVPVSVLGAAGIVWIVATSEIDKHPLQFARASRRFLPRVLGPYRETRNFMASNDEPALKWAMWIGAKIYEEPPVQSNGRDFLRFSIRRA